MRRTLRAWVIVDFIPTTSNPLLPPVLNGAIAPAHQSNSQLIVDLISVIRSSTNIIRKLIVIYSKRSLHFREDCGIFCEGEWEQQWHLNGHTGLVDFIGLVGFVNFIGLVDFIGLVRLNGLVGIVSLSCLDNLIGLNYLGLGVVGYTGFGLNGTSLLVGFTGVLGIVGFIRPVDFIGVAGLSTSSASSATLTSASSATMASTSTASALSTSASLALMAS